MFIGSSVLSEEDATLTMSFTLNYILKALSPNTVPWEVRASMQEFWTDTIPSTEVMMEVTVGMTLNVSQLLTDATISSQAAQGTKE